MVTGFSQRSAASAARWEIDLSGGTQSVPLSFLGGEKSFESFMSSKGLDFLLSQCSVTAFLQIVESYRTDTYTGQGDYR